MRQKRAKQYKRLMGLYNVSFGFREPYQILLDGDFFYTALQYKINLETQLSKVMQGATKQMYTTCSYTELCQNGDKEAHAAQIIQQFEKRTCSHWKSPVSSEDCLQSIIGTHNEHRYCVATQNRRLREKLRHIPGLPLLYINRTVLIIEPPSNSTLEKAKQIEFEKTLPPSEELLFLKKANSSISKDQVDFSSVFERKKKRKRQKQPNPLSCKKKKPKNLTAPIKNPQNPTIKVEKEMKLKESKNKEDAKKIVGNNEQKKEISSIQGNTNDVQSSEDNAEKIQTDRKRKRKRKLKSKRNVPKIAIGQQKNLGNEEETSEDEENSD
ncbi:hypothetical protein G9A89_022493 [Geosiphon pyriformis]|nr:hypothetical protein G9A89_022493 [Geosiphon pyriformis]